MYQTKLMQMIFSDSTADDFKEKVADKIEEAKANGTAELKDGNTNLNFAESNGDVVIEDKSNGNEVTVATDKGNEVELKAAHPATKSATQPNFKVGKPEGKGTEAPIHGTVNDVKVSIEPSITDKDQAGVDKHYSIVLSGFGSEAEAQAYFSQLTLEEDVISFSEGELEAVADDANKVKELAERVEGTKDPELTKELKEKAESLKAYSVLASNAGFEMSDLYEAACYYSDYADEMLTQIYSDMDVNEFFSELTEEEVNAYFSELDEVETQVLYSAIESEENYTFSEVEEAINMTYSNIELSTPITEYFSECTEEEVNAFFSNVDDEVADMIYSMIEEDENTSFSDVNEAINLMNTELTELFSEFTEEDVVAFSEEYGEDVAQLAFAMANDPEENYTFSDLCDCANELGEAKEDAETVKENAKEIGKAAEDMKASNDPELAKKVKILADANAEEAEEVEAKTQDPEVKQAKEMCQSYSAMADEVLANNGLDPKTINFSEVDLFSDGEGEEPKAPEAPKGEESKKGEEPKAPEASKGEEPKAPEAPKGEEPKGEEPKASKTFSAISGFEALSETKSFTDVKKSYQGSLDSCFTFRMNQ